MTFSTEIKGGAKLVRFALAVLCVLLFKNTHTVFFNTFSNTKQEKILQ